MCSILVEIMISTLWMFYPCFEWLFRTRAAASTMFPHKVFPFARTPPCSTDHSLSKTAPSTHLHMCAQHIALTYTMYIFCTRVKSTQASALSEIVPQRQKFVQVSHIFSFRCRRSDPPNCDTHSESKVDSPSNMYLSTL